MPPLQRLHPSRPVRHSLWLILLVSILACLPIQAEERLARTLTLTATPWPPYFDPTLPDDGLVTEIVRQALDHQGYRLEIKWLPWARALSMARQGRADGVLGAWYTDKRARDFSYSTPFLRNDLVLFKRRGETIKYSQLEDLKAYRIGVILGSGIYDLLQPEFAANIETVTSHRNNLKKLMKKRFDVMAAEKQSILYLLNNRHPEWRGAVEILEPALQVNALHLIISRKIDDHREITDAFNRGLQTMIDDGSYAALLNAHSLSDASLPANAPLPAAP